MVTDFTRLTLARWGRAFSLVELLVVIAIIAILSGLAAVGINDVVRSTQMDAAARALAGDIDFARQAALARNKNIRLRFERSQTPGGEVAFWQWQVGVVEKAEEEKADANFTPLRKKTSLPLGVILDDSTVHSPLLAALPRDADQKPTLTFRPNGEIEPLDGLPFADLSRWCLTLIPERLRDQPVAGMNDFVTIQIDPLTSRFRSFRP
jgi:uncharacterized protein (TIGR02596 family)